MLCYGATIWTRIPFSTYPFSQWMHYTFGTPLFYNPALPESRAAPTIDTYNRSTWPTVKQFIHSHHGSYVTSQTTTTSNITWLTRLHLFSYCKLLHDSHQIHRPLTVFEQFCTLPEVPRHTLSATYRLILHHTHGTLPKYTKAWSEELGIDISEEDWHKVFLFTHKSSILSYIQEKKLQAGIQMVSSSN